MKGQQLEEGVGRKKKNQRIQGVCSPGEDQICGLSVQFVAFEGLHNAAFSERTT